MEVGKMQIKASSLCRNMCHTCEEGVVVQTPLLVLM